MTLSRVVSAHLTAFPVSMIILPAVSPQSPLLLCSLTASTNAAMQYLRHHFYLRLKRFFLQFTLPYNQYVPSPLFQQSIIFLISRCIPFYLGPPIIYICSRPYKTRTMMLMPKTPVNKNHRSVFRENKIRTPRQRSHVLSVSKSKSKERFSHKLLRSCIF